MWCFYLHGVVGLIRWARHILLDGYLWYYFFLLSFYSYSKYSQYTVKNEEKIKLKKQQLIWGMRKKLNKINGIINLACAYWGNHRTDETKFTNVYFIFVRRTRTTTLYQNGRIKVSRCFLLKSWNKNLWKLRWAISPKYKISSV